MCAPRPRNRWFSRSDDRPRTCGFSRSDNTSHLVGEANALLAREHDGSAAAMTLFYFKSKLFKILRRGSPINLWVQPQRTNHVMPLLLHEHSSPAKTMVQPQRCTILKENIACEIIRKPITIRSASCLGPPEASAGCAKRKQFQCVDA